MDGGQGSRRVMALAVVAVAAAVVVAVLSSGRSAPGGGAPVATRPGEGASGGAQSEEGWILNDPERALSVAAREGKPVLIDFWADWCVWCRKMDEETYSDPGVKRAMEAYVPLKVDVDALPDLQKRFGAQALPTTVVVDPSGKEVGRAIGFQDAARFLRFLKDPKGGGP